jgi:hypothetical protein
MWVSKYEWDRLIERVKQLEDGVGRVLDETGMSYYYGETPYTIHAYRPGNYGDFCSLPINKVVRGIADHLGITYCKHPETEEFTTKKKC